MDRHDMELAKDMFYAEMGWDLATGMPTRDTLAAAGLEDVADALAEQGLLPA
jgi:aldehyde:ferredoxin oxidoreductase